MASAARTMALLRIEAPSVWCRYTDRINMPVSCPAWIHTPAKRPGEAAGDRSNRPPTSPIPIPFLTATHAPAEEPSLCVLVAGAPTRTQPSAVASCWRSVKDAPWEWCSWQAMTLAPLGTCIAARSCGRPEELRVRTSTIFRLTGFERCFVGSEA